MVERQIAVELLLDQSHVLKFANGTDDAQVEELIVGVVDEIGAVKEALGYVDDSEGDQLSINSMVHMVSTHGVGVDALILPFVHEFVNVCRLEVHRGGRLERLLLRVEKGTITEESC